MKATTDGLIIKQQNIGEQDKLVTVLTRDFGVIRAFVRGAKNIKSPKSAATGLLCYSKLGIYQSKDAYVIDEASVQELFFELRTDVEKVALAQYFCELAAFICPTEQAAPQQLSTLLNALYLLSKDKKNPLIIKACVEMRLAAMAGYMPDLIMCRGCGAYESERMYFSLSDSAVHCQTCFEKAPMRNCVEIDRGVLHALRHTVFAEDKKLFSFSLSDAGLEKLNYITESYVCKVLEKDLSTLHFYKTIRS